MKKILFLILLFIPLAVSAQLFKPVAPFPENNSRTFGALGSLNGLGVAYNHKWQWRIDGTIQLSELVYNKLDKQMQSNSVFGIGPSLGYQHYIPGENGEAFNNYGFGAGVLLGEKMKFVLQANLMQYFKVGLTISPRPSPEIFPIGLFFGGGITF